MNQGRIIVITGSPGTGKSTTAALVAKESDMDKSVQMGGEFGVSQKNFGTAGQTAGTGTSVSLP